MENDPVQNVLVPRPRSPAVDPPSHSLQCCSDAKKLVTSVRKHLLSRGAGGSSTEQRSEWTFGEPALAWAASLPERLAGRPLTLG